MSLAFVVTAMRVAFGLMVSSPRPGSNATQACLEGDRLACNALTWVRRAVEVFPDVAIGALCDCGARCNQSVTQPLLHEAGPFPFEVVPAPDAAGAVQSACTPSWWPHHGAMRSSFRCFSGGTWTAFSGECNLHHNWRKLSFLLRALLLDFPAYDFYVKIDTDAVLDPRVLHDELAIIGGLTLENAAQRSLNTMVGPLDSTGISGDASSGRPSSTAMLGEWNHPHAHSPHLQSKSSSPSVSLRHGGIADRHHRPAHDHGLRLALPPLYSGNAAHMARFFYCHDKRRVCLRSAPGWLRLEGEIGGWDVSDSARAARANATVTYAAGAVYALTHEAIRRMTTTHCVDRVSAVRCYGWSPGGATRPRGDGTRCEWGNDYEDTAVGLCAHLLSVPFMATSCYARAGHLAFDTGKCHAHGTAAPDHGASTIISTHPVKEPHNFLRESSRLLRRPTTAVTAATVR